MSVIKIVVEYSSRIRVDDENPLSSLLFVLSTIHFGRLGKRWKNVSNDSKKSLLSLTNDIYGKSRVTFVYIFWISYSLFCPFSVFYCCFSSTTIQVDTLENELKNLTFSLFFCNCNRKTTTLMMIFRQQCFISPSRRTLDSLHHFIVINLPLPPELVTCIHRHTAQFICCVHHLNTTRESHLFTRY